MDLNNLVALVPLGVKEDSFISLKRERICDMKEL